MLRPLRKSEVSYCSAIGGSSGRASGALGSGGTRDSGDGRRARAASARRGAPVYHDRPGRGRIAGRAEVLRRLPAISPTTWTRAAESFPVQLTRSWLDRIRSADGPLGLQALPHERELVPDPGDRADPVGEGRRSPVPWVVQKHADRALLLLTRRCHLYCRYCFRRGQEGPADPTPAELDAALAWIRQRGVREMILSGGDPLAVRDRRIFSAIDAVRPAVPVVRIHTRAPITAPFRVTDALVAGLAERAPVWVIVHANHPDELSPDVRRALAALVDAGIPVLNQAVLLAGVNDDPAVLAELFGELTTMRVFPYYLHHPDPAPGNAMFRLSTRRGLRIYSELASRVSGIALPRYVIDPPDGLGKLDVAEWVHAGGRRPVPSDASPSTPQQEP
ncbi:MAG: KamA family radical SAM protein [Deltaproteobacteria bacterium]|nr:MAG: KamA family radical SAM protein [Deltaproteobacteria bacterium]